MTAMAGSLEMGAEGLLALMMFISVQPGWVLVASFAPMVATGICAGKAPVVKLPVALPVAPPAEDMALIW